MKALVTGGLGLIGYNIVQKLAHQEIATAIVDNLSNYHGAINMKELGYLYGERLKTLHELPQKYVSLNYLHKDIERELDIESCFNFVKPDIVYHMACPPRQKIVGLNPALCANTMTGGLLNVLMCCVKYKVKRLVFISSSMVYGDFDDNVTEDAICNPQGEYGILKLAGEGLVKDYNRKYGLNYTIIRPSAVYGPLDLSDRVISKFLLTAMGNGELTVNGENETLDFTYVDDAATGIAQAGLSEEAENKTYNITKSHSKTLLAAAQLAVEIAGKGSITITSKDDDFPSRGALDITAAVNDFGYNPKVDIEEGFNLYHEWLSNSVYWNQKAISKFAKTTT
jgi:nucleoside-diphosphate-sugar epimerase|tara:strand:- start:426 stop:1442 length:1017 start_codon:yes stop_codon:yes gene_type:complete